MIACFSSSGGFGIRLGVEGLRKAARAVETSAVGSARIWFDLRERPRLLSLGALAPSAARKRFNPLTLIRATKDPPMIAP
jgi:hypothetical protein